MTIHSSIPVGSPAWVDLSSNDTGASRTFYSGLFGWTYEAAPENFGGYVTAFKDGQQVAGIVPSQPGDATNRWATYLAVADATQTTGAAAAAGGGVALEPMAVGELGTMGFLNDPSGATIGLWQPGTHSGFAVTEVEGAPAWFELHTRDFAAAIPFYTAVFGWSLEVMGDTDEFRYSVLKVEDTQHAGVMDAATFLPDGVPSQWVVYFQASDADKAVADALLLGGSVTRPVEDTPYGRLASLRDSTGASFNVIQRP